MAAPITAMRSKCKTCNNTFYHTDVVTLARLRDVPGLLRELPFDPHWNFGEVSLGRTPTSNTEVDVTKKQGVSTVLEKVAKLGTESVQRTVECYLCAGQARSHPAPRLRGRAHRLAHSPGPLPLARRHHAPLPLLGLMPEGAPSQTARLIGAPLACAGVVGAALHDRE